jgi:hypothetical protein
MDVVFVGGTPQYINVRDRKVSKREHLNVLPSHVIDTGFGYSTPVGVPIGGLPLAFVPGIGPAFVGPPAIQVEHMPQIDYDSGRYDDAGVRYFDEKYGYDTWRKDGGRWIKYTPVYRSSTHHVPSRTVYRTRPRTPSPPRRHLTRVSTWRVGATYIIPSSSSGREIKFKDTSFSFDSKTGTYISVSVVDAVKAYAKADLDHYVPEYDSDSDVVRINWYSFHKNGTLYFSLNNEKFIRL